MAAGTELLIQADGPLSMQHWMEQLQRASETRESLVSFHIRYKQDIDLLHRFVQYNQTIENHSCLSLSFALFTTHDYL